MAAADEARLRLFQSYLPAAVSLDCLPLRLILAAGFLFRLKPDIARLIGAAEA
jgi:hypothetical protein